MPSVELDLSGATLSVRWHAPGTHRALALFGDDVWVYRFAATEADWAATAGTFRVAADPAERAALVTLAAAIDGDSGGRGSDGGRGSSGGGGNGGGGDLHGGDQEPASGLALLLGVGPRTARIAPGSATAARIGAAVAPLLERAGQTPVSAVRLQADVVQPPGGMAAVLGLRFAAIGVEPAVVTLGADQVRLVLEDGSWRTLAAPAMGLVDPEGNLLDGLHAPATIPAGRLGAWILPGSPVTAPPGIAAAAAPAERVLISGRITVAGPVPPGAVEFELSAPLGRFASPG